jgi:predicted DNA-binding protein (UPF0278 family)
LHFNYFRFLLRLIQTFNFTGAVMILIPEAVYKEFLGLLESNNVPLGYHSEYLKWLRYYLDFCAKYVITIDESERLQQFLAKLRAKKQSDAQRKRAAHAISLYFEMRSIKVEQSPRIEESKQRPSGSKLGSGFQDGKLVVNAKGRSCRRLPT